MDLNVDRATATTIPLLAAELTKSMYWEVTPDKREVALTLPFQKFKQFFLLDRHQENIFRNL
jgi:hypothetical protein